MAETATIRIGMKCGHEFCDDDAEGDIRHCLSHMHAEWNKIENAKYRRLSDERYRHDLAILRIWEEYDEALNAMMRMPLDDYNDK